MPRVAPRMLGVFAERSASPFGGNQPEGGTESEGHRRCRGPLEVKTESKPGGRVSRGGGVR